VEHIQYIRITLISLGKHLIRRNAEEDYKSSALGYLSVGFTDFCINIQGDPSILLPRSLLIIKLAKIITAKDNVKINVRYISVIDQKVIFIFINLYLNDLNDFMDIFALFSVSYKTRYKFISNRAGGKYSCLKYL
jgi:hypothetical protein